MGLSFFNAERIRKERLEKLNATNITSENTSDEEPTSPDLFGVEVGTEEPKEVKVVEEQVVKPAKRKRKQ